jgi:hypothetical protein
MAFAYHDPTTMSRVEVLLAGTAKKRWRLEDGPMPATGFVLLITPERGSDSNGKPI